jgi:hypothetical protein
MVYSLLAFLFSMIAVFAAAVGTMIGLSNFSTSEGVGHYPRAVVERDIAATNREPRLFMVVPDTKDGSPAKNMEAAAVPAEKPDATKSKPHKCSVVSVATTNNPATGMRGVTPKRLGTGRGVYFSTGDPTASLPAAVL